MKVISVRLHEQTYEELERRADRAGLPVAVLARAYLKESVEDREDFSEIVRNSKGPSSATRSKNKKRRR